MIEYLVLNHQKTSTILQNMEMTKERIPAMKNRKINKQIEGFYPKLFVLLRLFYLYEGVLVSR